MKLGMIAISGLRVCDTGLLEKGLSFPSLAGRAQEIEALPSLGLLTLAGMTPKGVDVEYLEVRDVDYDLLFSVTQASVPRRLGVSLLRNPHDFLLRVLLA